MSNEGGEGGEERGVGGGDRERTEQISVICCILGRTVSIFRQLIISFFSRPT